MGSYDYDGVVFLSGQKFPDFHSQILLNDFDFWQGLGANGKAKKYKMESSFLGETWVRCLHPYIEPKSQLAPKSDKV